MQVMAAHHSDIYLKKEYWDESLVYEVISEEYIDEEVPIVRCGIFVLKGLNSSSMTGMSMWLSNRYDHCCSLLGLHQ